MMAQGTTDVRDLPIPTPTPVVVLELDGRALSIVRRALEHDLGTATEEDRLALHRLVRSLQSRLNAESGRQPACGNLDPHKPHNGFATENPKPWCEGVPPRVDTPGPTFHTELINGAELNVGDIVLVEAVVTEENEHNHWYARVASSLWNTSNSRLWTWGKPHGGAKGEKGIMRVVRTEAASS